MPKRAKSGFWKVLWFLLLPPLVFCAWIFAYSFTDIQLRQAPLQFSLKQGSSLRSVARQMQGAGALNSPWQFELLARLNGDETRIQAGNYEITGAITPYRLLQKITSREYSQNRITLIEGWTWAQVRAALDAHPAINHETSGLPDAEVMARLQIAYPSPEGVFFPSTYFFAAGDSDTRVLRRAYLIMQSQLDTLWKTRAGDVPLETPYQALILASIIEKETGRGDERPLIAAVFANRLKAGMKLQTDPTVIFGMGENFHGNLRKADLSTDGPYNTYTRNGLPPTPISIPGRSSLTAAINPAPGNALYFVSRGDGTSHFSGTLAEHERAVTQYQRGGNR